MAAAYATMLPGKLVPTLQAHLEIVKAIHKKDLLEDFGSVYLSDAHKRKYPNASREWIWQYIFPAKNCSKDPHSDVKRRHHLHESGLQEAVKNATWRFGIEKRVTPHFSPFRCHPSPGSRLPHSNRPRTAWP